MQSIRSILNAHGTAEGTSAIFTKDQRYGFAMSLIIGVVISGVSSKVLFYDILLLQFSGQT